MPISTPLTSLLGIRHPVLSAPMAIIAGSRLVAAVGRAGGFGILGGGYGEKEWLEQETAKLQKSSVPFGVGFITWSMARKPEHTARTMRMPMILPPSQPDIARRTANRRPGRGTGVAGTVG